MKTVRQFYDSLAPSYDGMTLFEERMKKDRKIFASLVKRYKIKTALDAGAGTGFHSILLSSLGVDVTAVDLSLPMLKRAEKNARHHRVKIKTVHSDFLSIGKKITGDFDGIFCLGNSLPHLNGRELDKTLKIFLNKLRPGGTLILQILNYDRILDKKEFLLNVRVADNHTTLRYYGIKNKSLIFNLLSIRAGKNDENSHITINSVKHYPIRHKYILGLLKNAGFAKIQSYGSIKNEIYNRRKSIDVFLIAEKPIIA